MKQRTFKRGIIAAFLSFVFVLSVFYMPASFANAETGTLGTESPAVTASYTGENGRAVDGNALTTGIYRMTISLAGMKAVSHMEFSADYEPGVVSFSNPEFCLSENYDFEAIPELYEGGEFVFGYSSNDEHTTQIDAEGTDLYAIDVTVTSEIPVDMNEAITVDTVPHWTFIEADYGDIEERDGVSVHNCYALGTLESFAGTVYPMTCDLSPELTSFSVNGSVVVMLNPNDPDNTAGANGLEGVQLIINGDTVATTEADGSYEFSIESGEYDVTLHHETGYDRIVKLIVNNSAVTAEPITLINCDFSRNDDDNIGVINVNDTSLYEAGLAVGNLKYDITRSDGVNINDTAVYELFVAKGSVKDIYTSVTIQ